ncbi:MAG: hypothetical protein H7838_09245 [Magnetococcus sp. DMHC-8]
MSSDESPRGVVFKIFGAVLIFVSTLNIMLFWRAGLFMDNLFVVFFLVGLGCYAVGMGRARYAVRNKGESS